MRTRSFILFTAQQQHANEQASERSSKQKKNRKRDMFILYNIIIHYFVHVSLKGVYDYRRLIPQKMCFFAVYIFFTLADSVEQHRPAYIMRQEIICAI